MTARIDMWISRSFQLIKNPLYKPEAYDQLVQQSLLSEQTASWLAKNLLGQQIQSPVNNVQVINLPGYFFKLKDLLPDSVGAWFHQRVQKQGINILYQMDLVKEAITTEILAQFIHNLKRQEKGVEAGDAYRTADPKLLPEIMRYLEHKLGYQYEASLLQRLEQLEKTDN
jgi:hypothetical protein